MAEVFYQGSYVIDRAIDFSLKSSYWSAKSPSPHPSIHPSIHCVYHVEEYLIDFSYQFFCGRFTLKFIRQISLLFILVQYSTQRYNNLNSTSNFCFYVTNNYKHEKLIYYSIQSDTCSMNSSIGVSVSIRWSCGLDFKKLQNFYYIRNFIKAHPNPPA